MSSGRLFLQRLINEWKFQFGVFRTVFDWTVVAYLLTPCVIIFGFTYRSWWLEIPDWVNNLPIGILFFVFYIITWRGQFRTYVQDADQLFLLKHRQLFLRLKVWASVYTVVFQALLLGLVLLLLLPFFIYHYQLSIGKMATLFLLFISLNLFIMAVKVKLKKISMRLLQNVLTIIHFIILGVILKFVFPIWNNEQFFLLLLISCGFLLMAGIIFIPYVKKVSEFEVHLMIEKMERTKYINLIFNFSYEIEKTNIITRKRPWLFRKSQRIFKKRTPKRGFLELFAKVFIRNPLHITSFLQMNAITSMAIIYLPPIWIKVLIFLGGILVLKVWAQLVWEKIILAHPLTKKYGEYDDYYVAGKWATNFIVVIGGTILSIAFLLSNIVENYFTKFFM